MDHFQLFADNDKSEKFREKYIETFDVLPRLMGLVIGKNGSNINKIQSITNVTRIDHINKGNITQLIIKGKTKKAVIKARKMLEYIEKRIEVPLEIANKINENNREIIKKIIEKSGVIRIEVRDDVSSDTEYTPFIFIGTVDCVEKAETILNYQVDLLKTADKDDIKDVKFTNNKKKIPSNTYVEQFEVLQRLMNFVIGKHGSNINQARNITNVIQINHVDKKDLCQITIKAKTEKAAIEARKMLEYIEKCIDVPLEIANKIYVNNGEIIKKIIEKSGVIRIEVRDDVSSDTEYTPFIFIGTVDCVEKAETILNYQVDLLKTADKDDIKDVKFTNNKKKYQVIRKYVEKFEVLQRLMGLVIGKHGSNIIQARNITNVIKINHVDKKDLCQITIKAKTEKAAIEARKMLEYIEKCIDIPLKIANKINENNREIIKKIIEKSGVIRIEVRDDVSSDTEYTPFIFIGTVDCVEKAETILNYQVDLLKTADKDDIKDVKFTNNKKKIPSNTYVEKFEVLQRLMGLVIGKHGSNIIQARNITNVIKINHVDKKDLCQITIKAKTEKAAIEARNLLEYIEKRIDVPLGIANKIGVNNGEIIEKIVEKSGVIRIEVGDDSTSSDVSSSDSTSSDSTSSDGEYTPIIFVGTRDSVKKAETMFNSVIDQLKESDEEIGLARNCDNDEKNFNSYTCFEKFMVKKNLLGLAIGKNGSNIKNAEKIPGISEINLNKNEFTIYGYTKEAIAKAKSYLNYDQINFAVQKINNIFFDPNNTSSIQNFQKQMGVSIILKTDKSIFTKNTMLVPSERGNRYSSMSVNTTPKESILAEISLKKSFECVCILAAISVD
ncbi:hypothetical protein PGB90_009351 [Kerria lacca]